MFFAREEVKKAIASLEEGQDQVAVGAVNGPKMTVVSGRGRGCGVIEAGWYPGSQP